MHTEEEFVELVKQLKPVESALLNWAVDLMADVVVEEDYNKMDARNIAMVFAPNMTQMSDPLTALMHAVQVMNLLKTLILKTLRDREETATAEYSSMSSHSSDEYDSQQEMYTSGELKRTKLDYDDHVDYSHNIEEAASALSEIEECFLEQLDDVQTKRFTKEKPAEHLQEELESPTKTEDSCLSSSYRNGSTTTEGSNADTSSPSIESKDTNDVEMVDKFSDSVSLLPLFASN